LDVLGGTSTGALIALALSLRNKDGTERFTASQVVQPYERRGTEIFPPSFRSALHTAVHAIRHKYSSRPFERFLLDVFGAESLQAAATNLLVTSFDTEAMQPHCIKKRPVRGDWVNDGDYCMRDVARASAAAPTYVPPAHISPIGKEPEKFSLVEGAMFANNPTPRIPA